MQDSELSASQASGGEKFSSFLTSHFCAPSAARIRCNLSPKARFFLTIYPQHVTLHASATPITVS
jgi:hypothetical protein